MCRRSIRIFLLKLLESVFASRPEDKQSRYDVKRYASGTRNRVGNINIHIRHTFFASVRLARPRYRRAKKWILMPFLRLMTTDRQRIVLSARRSNSAYNPSRQLFVQVYCAAGGALGPRC